MITEPGIYPEMPEDVYHDDPVPGGSLSSTMAKLLVQPGGPAKLQELSRTPRAPKPEFDIGQAVHSLALGAGAELALIPHDEWRTKETKAAVQEARDAGKVPLKPAQWDQVHAMVDALHAHDQASGLLTDGAPEVSAFAEVDGLWLRARFDWLTHGCAVDLKTATAADPESFARDAAKFGYHVQQAHYQAVAAALGMPADSFLFIVQEKAAPYLVSVIELDADYAALGRAEHAHAMDLWRACRDAGEWPGYADHTVTIPPPPWLRYRSEAHALDTTPEPAPDLHPDFAAQLALLAGTPCRNTLCANPAHMEPVEKSENVRREWAARKQEEVAS